METDETQTKLSRRLAAVSSPVPFAALAVLALLACILFTFLLFWLGRPRPLKPFRFTATPGDFYVDGRPETVTFTELNNNAAAYQNKFIRVTGNYFPQKLPGCAPYSGPVFRSVLVAEDLQLDVLGGETALRLAPPNTLLTVEGIWRKYEGSVGCGKEPPRQTLWYLEITNIVAPNPIVGVTPESAAPGDAPPPTNTPALGVNIPTPTAVATTTAVPTPTATPLDTIPTPTTVIVMTVTPDLTATGTAALPPTNTPTPNGSGTPTPTGTLTTTPTPTNTGTPGTPPPSATPQPPLGTSTPGGSYPPPPGTPSPTPSPTAGSGY